MTDRPHDHDWIQLETQSRPEAVVWPIAAFMVAAVVGLLLAIVANADQPTGVDRPAPVPTSIDFRER